MNVQSAAFFAALLGFGGAAAVAQANIITTTFEGTVTGSDDFGFFGSANSDLTGQRFTAVYTTNDLTPGDLLVANLTSAAREGGTFTGGDGSNAPTRVVLTIGGISVSTALPVSPPLSAHYISAIGVDRVIVPNVYAFVFAEDSIQTNLAGGVETLDIRNSLSSSTNAFVPFPDYTAPVSYTAQVGDTGDGAFIYQYGSVHEQLLLTADSVKNASAAVPEPATWALMIGGFGLAGVALRRRRTTLAA